MLTALPDAQAAETTPLDNNPGPTGSFTWKMLNWDKRYCDGGSHYRVTSTRPTSATRTPTDTSSYPSPTPPATPPWQLNPVQPDVASDMAPTAPPWRKNFSALLREVVCGCLFTCDPDANPGHTEIDLCEASAWGGGAVWGGSWPVEQGHGYWFDATKPTGQGNNTVSFPASSNNTLTHKMVWEPGKITFETYAGESYVDPL